jgi:predicted O-methyltransferase YrrM
LSVTPSDVATIVEHLKEVQERGDAIVSMMTPRERLLLYTLTLCLNPRRYLEIGSFQGGSALIVCSALDTLNNARGKIFMVDPDFRLTEQTWSHISHRATRIEGESPGALAEAHRLAGGAFDLVLVDGAHQVAATVSDIVSVYEYVSPGGYVVVHDSSNFEVRDALDYVLRQGQYTDVGLVCDETFYGGEFHDAGRHRGKKCFACGTYVLRRAAQISRPTGIGALLPLLVPPILMPIANQVTTMLRSMISPKKRV